MNRLLSSADFWSGLACAVLGTLALWAGADYALGSAGRLGPGYVPRLLGWLLVGLGALLVVRSAFSHDSVEAGFAVRPVLLVLLSVLVFAAAFAWLGMVPAILAAVAVANFAVAENTWRSAVAIGLLLAVFAWALFVVALKLPLPVFLP